MPSYNLKSQKRSQSQSKNGGRRKKRTLKNVRRRKSRKVMMGGGKQMVTLNYVIDELIRMTPDREGSFQSDFQAQFKKTWDDYILEKGGPNAEIDIDTLINDPLWADWKWKIKYPKFDNVKTQLEGIKSQE